MLDWGIPEIAEQHTPPEQPMNELIALKASDLAFTPGPQRKSLTQQLTDQLMELEKEEVISILLEAVCIAGTAGLRNSG